MEQIFQIFDMIKTVVQTIFTGWNIAAVILGAAAIITGVRYVVIKKGFDFLRSHYKNKLTRVEEKIREFTLSGKTKNLTRNLKKREVLRIKAAKLGVSLKSEVGLDNITYNQSKLSKHDKKFIIRDAKLNLYKIKGKDNKHRRKSKKWGVEKLDRQVDNEFTFTQSIEYPAGNKIYLNSNSIYSQNKAVVKNYQSDVNIVNSKEAFPLRVGKKNISPLVLEISDENNNTIFSLNDVSPKRFLQYSAEGHAFLNDLLEKNNRENDTSLKSYNIKFYDTGTERNVSAINVTVNTPAQFQNYLSSFVDNFNHIKVKKDKNKKKNKKNKEENKENKDNSVNKDNNENKDTKLNYAQIVNDKSLYYSYNKETKKTTSQRFKYSSKDMRSHVFEAGLESIIEQNLYTYPDAQPQLVSLTIDDKEVFNVRIPNEDLLKITKPVIDAYIFVLLARRILKQQQHYTIEKSTKGYVMFEEELNGVKVKVKKFRPTNEKIKDLEKIHKQHEYSKEFFAAFVRVAKDLKVGISKSFLDLHNITLKSEEYKILEEHLGEFQYKDGDNAYKLFGLDNKEEKKTKTTYTDISEDPEGFEHAYHYQQVAKYKSRKNKITTSLPNLEKKFYEDNSAEQTSVKIDKIPNTVDVIITDTKETKGKDILFQLGAIVVDDEKFKYYLHSILMETLYLLTPKNETNKDGGKINVYISYQEGKKTHSKPIRFNSLHELRAEIRSMGKKYGFKGIEDFKKEFTKD